MKFFIAIIFILSFLYPFAAVGGDDVPDSFKNYIPYKLGSNLLYLHPELSEKAKIVNESSGKDSLITSIVLPFASDSLSIFYSSGPSDDPTFIIKYKDMVEYVGGEKLYISSSGFFYLVKRSNEYFKKNLKYQISDGKFKEIEQPFYLVDQECETSTSLYMYDSKCNGGNLVATLPKGTVVHILLMEKADKGCSGSVVPDNDIGDPVNNYLVSTPFGLVGWVASSGGYLTRPGKPLESLRFFGD